MAAHISSMSESHWALTLRLSTLCAALVSAGTLAGCQLLLIPYAGLCLAFGETWPDSQALPTPIVLGSAAGAVFSITAIAFARNTDQANCIASVVVEISEEKSAKPPIRQQAFAYSEAQELFLKDGIVRTIRSACSPSRIQYVLRAGPGPDGFKAMRQFYRRDDGTYEDRPMQLCGP